MSRNASGVYSLPNPPVIPGTTIDATDENQTRSDIATEITSSLDRSGRGGMLAALKLIDGTVGAPGWGFSSDPDNGAYRAGNNDWGLTVGGADAIRFLSTAITMALPLIMGDARYGVISPAQLVANTNDWAPAGLATAGVIRVSTDATRNLTGLTGGAAGRIVYLHNVGAQQLVLVDESVSSAVANRFALPYNVTLYPDASLALQYDATTQRWRVMGVTLPPVGSNGSIPMADSTQPTGIVWVAGGGFTTGDVKATIKTVADTGWVMMNDGTIGNGASGGTTRANADTEALFTLLWNNTANAQCAVSGGRGANAAADFAANKNIALPKALGRALASAGAGSGLTARVLAEALGSENAIVVTHDHGAVTGAQSADHTHSGTTSSDGAHGHNLNFVSQSTAGSTTDARLGFDTGSGFGLNATADAGNRTATSSVASGGAHQHTITTGGISSGHTHSITSAGSSGTGANVPPEFCLNFMIKL